MSVHVFGIRHHGPGCARSLVAALERLEPDAILVEGPPDADERIAELDLDGFEPPVAIVVHRSDDPRRAVFYPFAEYSPEWQALRFARRRGVPARFCDLAQAHVLARTDDEARAEEHAGEAPRDALSWLARADGYRDGERWWNDRIEERGDDAALFEAIGEALAALRAELALPESLHERRREAAMRRAVRTARKSGAQRIAVVCGAWHAPAIDLEAFTKAHDDALLEKLSKTKVESTWSPWTNDRLTAASGYGAGVVSPGWYEHVWRQKGATTERFLTRAARVLRTRDTSASSASVIDATRLAEALAALRGRGRAGLDEILDATRHVFAAGGGEFTGILARQLLVGDRLGALPDGLVRLPLQRDLEAERRRLRLEQTAAPKRLELDLREPGGRARSAFLHRLLALHVPWGELESGVRSRGTFKEVWQLRWRPEFSVALVDASAFGNTVESAAAKRIVDDAERASGLAALVELLERALLADVGDVAGAILERVENSAAVASESASLLDALPPIVRIVRYGSVRETDGAALRRVAQGLALRAHLAVAAAADGIDDEAAAGLVGRLRAHHAALALLEERDLVEQEREVLARLAERTAAHPRVRGLAVRMLRDAEALTSGDVATRLGRETSAGAPPDASARWLEGFLDGAGAVLVHDTDLVRILDAWLVGLSHEHFHDALPIVRRAFGAFTPPERRSIANVLAHGGRARTGVQDHALVLDSERAAAAVSAAAHLLGLAPRSH